MTTHGRQLAWIALFVLLNTGLPCTPLCGDQDGDRLFADLNDRSLDDFSLIEAAMLIGGADGASAREADLHLFSEVRTKIVPLHLPTLDRARTLIDWMHEQWLTGRYRTSASQLSDTIASGNYNCVSAATLFLGLAEMSQISARGVLLPGHLRCRIWVPERHQWVDIEPTRRTGFVVQESEGTPGRELTRVQVLATLYYNRGIELMSERDYWTALRCARYGWQLDPDHEAARDSVVAVYSQWSVSLCERRQFAEAARLIAKARVEFPHDASLAASEIHTYVAWMGDFARSGDHAAARMRLADVLTRHPDSRLLRELEVTLRKGTFAMPVRHESR